MLSTRRALNNLSVLSSQNDFRSNFEKLERSFSDFWKNCSNRSIGVAYLDMRCQC